MTDLMVCPLCGWIGRDIMCDSNAVHDFCVSTWPITRPWRTDQVRCPKCEARPLQACVTPKGERRGVPHVARRAAHPGWDRKAQEWRSELEPKGQSVD